MRDLTIHDAIDILQKYNRELLAEAVVAACKNGEDKYAELDRIEQKQIALDEYTNRLMAFQEGRD